MPGKLEFLNKLQRSHSKIDTSFFGDMPVCGHPILAKTISLNALLDLRALIAAIVGDFLKKFSF